MTIAQYLMTATIGTWVLFVVLLAGFRTRSLAACLTALVLQILLSAVLFFLFDFAPDAEYYVTSRLDFDQIPQTKWGLTALWFALEFAAGWNVVPAIILISLFPALVPAIAAASCRNFGLQAYASVAAWVAAFMPPMLIWAPLLRREGLVYFLLSLVVLGMSWAYVGLLKQSALLFAVLCLALYFTRGQLVLVVLAAALGSLLLTQSRRKLEASVAVGLIALAALILVPGALNAALLGQAIEQTLVQNSDPAQRTGIPSASYEYNYSLIGFLRNFVASLVGPFPWEWRGLRWVLLSIDGLLYMVLAGMTMWAYVRRRPYRRLISILVIPSTVMAIGFSLSLANYGLNARLRSHYWVLLLPLIALGLGQFLASVSARYRLSAIVRSAPRDLNNEAISQALYLRHGMGFRRSGTSLGIFARSGRVCEPGAEKPT